MNLSFTVLSSFVWRSLGISGQRLLSFLVLMALARLLSTQEFGTAATATMIVLLLHPITRFGVYDYLIQRDTVESKTKTASVIVGFFFGSILSLSVYLAAPAIGRVFSDDELVNAVRLLSTIFLFAPVSTVQEGILAKQFKFKAIAACQLAAFIPAGLVGIGLAVAGMGVFSVVTQQIILSFLTSLFFWFADPWRPMFTGCRSELITIFRSGFRYTISQTFTSLNTNLFGIGVAFVSGTEAAGFFRIAWSGLLFCVQMVIQPASNVMQPVFAALQGDSTRLHHSFIKSVRYISVLSFPIFTLVAGLSSQLVVMGFGNQWRDAGPVLSIMCFFVFAGAANYVVRAFLLAVGRPEQSIVLGAFETIVGVGAIFAFGEWGIYGIACAVVARAWLVFPASVMMVRRHIPVTFGMMLSVMALPMLASLSAGAFVYYIKGELISVFPLLLATAWSGVLGTVMYAGLLWILDRSLLVEMARVVWGMLRRV